MPPVRTIKKYPNRRLYDTDISSYITLEDVRQLILDGEAFEVRDARSGEDLTRSVLLQIIAEHEEKGRPIFSAALLTQIIRNYGDSLQPVMGEYLERSLQLFLEQQSQFRNQFSGILGPSAWGLLNTIAEKNLEIWKSFQQGLTGTPVTPTPTPPPAPSRGRGPRKTRAR